MNYEFDFLEHKDTETQRHRDTEERVECTKGTLCLRVSVFYSCFTY